jgi:hypothetical protein
MRVLILAAALLLSGCALGGCASVPGLNGGPVDPNQTLKTFNEHIETCERHYQGGLGVGAAFTFRVDCPARPFAQPIVPLSQLGMDNPPKPAEPAE